MILVTGATGFIGRHLAGLLVSRGCAVRCLVRRTSATAGLPAVELAYGDLAEGRGIEDALRGVSCVIHLAGTTKALRSQDYYRGNVDATAALVRAMDGHPARLVFASSLAAAGPSAGRQPLDEDAVPAPFTHYGISKLRAERIARGRPGTVIVRPPVVYGPGDTDVFQLLRAISRGLVVEIAGGERWISAVYVKDLAEGLAIVAEHPDAAGRTYYLTHPEPFTWGELSGIAAGIMGKRPRRVCVPYALARAVGWGAEIWSRMVGRPGILSREKVAEARCSHWTCSGVRAARELGYNARTPLHEGLNETLRWYREAGWLKW